jgi:hypothetical protein
MRKRLLSLVLGLMVAPLFAAGPQVAAAFTAGDVVCPTGTHWDSTLQKCVKN